MYRATVHPSKSMSFSHSGAAPSSTIQSTINREDLA